jgi:hypothetical protein
MVISALIGRILTPPSWAGIALEGRDDVTTDPEAPVMPERGPPMPRREDPRYPSHTPPRPQQDPSPVELPDDESFPACWRDR